MRTKSTGDVTVRAHRIGDLGQVVSRHGVLYGEEHGFDITFEALVAEIAAEFLRTFDPTVACSRIAECDGRIVGSAFVVRIDAETAKLRLVLVEPEMRGTGLGRVLVEDCIAFARSAGYRRMTLWTQDFLVPARRLYASLGFTMVASNPAEAFGKSMVEETWERAL